jgi:hypothetical protein
MFDDQTIACAVSDGRTQLAAQARTREGDFRRGGRPLRVKRGILASGSHAYEGRIVALLDWRITGPEPLAFYPATGNDGNTRAIRSSSVAFPAAFLKGPTQVPHRVTGEISYIPTELCENRNRQHHPARILRITREKKLKELQRGQMAHD